jgi:hypothetical protein
LFVGSQDNGRSILLGRGGATGAGYEAIGAVGLLRGLHSSFTVHSINCDLTRMKVADQALRPIQLESLADIIRSI